MAQKYGGRTQPDPIPIEKRLQEFVDQADKRFMHSQERRRSTGLLSNREQTAAIRLGGAVIPSTATTYLDLDPSVASPVIQRTTSGLIGSDSFNRTAGGTVGGGWSEQEEADWSLHNDAGRSVLEHADTDAADDFCYQDFNTFPQDFIVEYIVDVMVDDADESIQLSVGNSARNPDYGDECLTAVMYPKGDLVRLYRRTGGNSTQIGGDQSVTIGQNQKWAFRVVGVKDGANYDYWIYATQHTSWDDTTTDHGSAVLSVDDDLPVPSYGSINMISAKQRRRFANFFICGRTITVNDVPTGYSIQIDSRTAVHETGNTVTFDVDQWNLPATQIKLLDESLQQRATLSPSGGIYGGDEYAITAASYLMYHDDGSGSPAFALYADGAVYSTGTFVGGVIQDTTPPNAQIIMTGEPAVADYIDLSATGSDVLMSFGDLTILKTGTVKLDSISESTSGSGVTVDDLTIKDGGFSEARVVIENTSKITFDLNNVFEGYAGLWFTTETPSVSNYNILGKDDGTGLYLNVATGGTIELRVNNTSIATLDATNKLKIDAINEYSGEAGVTIDGLLVKDSGLTASGTVAVSGVMQIPTAAPAEPANGDVWVSSGKLYYREGGTTYEVQGL